MGYLLTTDTDLKKVADAIREKAEITGNLEYPDGFVDAIDEISVGKDCTATAADVRVGKTAIVDGEEITGTIPDKAAGTYYPLSTDQTIASGQYLAGTQTIKKVKLTNVSAANIKNGVTVKVGDDSDDDRVTAITGTFTSDANATASQILSGKTAYVGGSKVTGTIASKAAETFYPSTSADQTVAKSQYLSGVQTFKKLKLTNVAAANIKSGVTVKVGDDDDDDRVTAVAGTFTSDANATAAQILSGKTAYVNGTKITGTIASKAAETFYPSTSADQTVAKSQYLSGVQTFKKLKLTNISAANIKAGVTVKVGDDDDDDRVTAIAGTFTSDANATAAQILSGKTAYVNGAKVTGTIASKAAATITPTETAQTIASGQYLSGAQTIAAIPSSYVGSGVTQKAAATYNTYASDRTISAGTYIAGTQTIKAVTTSGISAGNIKKDAVVKVGDANSATRIKNVTGTFTGADTVSSGQTAAAATEIRSGYSAWVDGAEVKGSIADLAAKTYNTSTSNQTIPAGKYISGTQTIRAVTTSGISAANIKAGVTVKVGDSGSSARITSVTGSFTSDATATAAEIVKDKTAYVNGAKVTGTMASKTGATYGLSTSVQTISSGQYLSGDQTIKAVENKAYVFDVLIDGQQKINGGQLQVIDVYLEPQTTISGTHFIGKIYDFESPDSIDPHIAIRGAVIGSSDTNCQLYIYSNHTQTYYTGTRIGTCKVNIIKNK